MGDIIKRISPEQAGEITSLVMFGDVHAHTGNGRVEYIEIKITLKKFDEAQDFINSLKTK